RVAPTGVGGKADVGHGRRVLGRIGRRFGRGGHAHRVSTLGVGRQTRREQIDFQCGSDLDFGYRRRLQSLDAENPTEGRLGLTIGEPHTQSSETTSRLVAEADAARRGVETQVSSRLVERLIVGTRGPVALGHRLDEIGVDVLEDLVHGVLGAASENELDAGGEDGGVDRALIESLLVSGSTDVDGESGEAQQDQHRTGDDDGGGASFAVDRPPQHEKVTTPQSFSCSSRAVAVCSRVMLAGKAQSRTPVRVSAGMDTVTVASSPTSPSPVSTRTVTLPEATSRREHALPGSFSPTATSRAISAAPWRTSRFWVNNHPTSMMPQRRRIRRGTRKANSTTLAP